MKHAITFLLAGCMAISGLHAQSLSGILTNAKMKPIKEREVWIKNSLAHTQTDKEGHFTLENIQPSDTLEIIYSGTKTALIPVQQMENPTIILDKKNILVKTGEESITLPYSRPTYESGNPNVMNGTQIARLGITNIYDLLRNYFAGVNVISGEGGTMQINIRGTKSFLFQKEPLFYVDNVEYESSADVNSSVDVTEIESIEVNKDGMGYGVKGANGVIIITTKGSSNFAHKNLGKPL